MKCLLFRSIVVSLTLLAVTPQVSPAEDPPTTLANAKAQFYNFLMAIATHQGITNQQRIVLNSTIVPMDLSLETPFYNQELFRLYADRTFRGGVENVQPTPPMASSTRFSAQYRTLIELAAAQVDQNHPEIKNSISELLNQLSEKTKAYTNKITELETNWNTVATGRSLVPGTPNYELQRVTWFAQISYADQIAQYTQDIEKITGQLDAVRRKVYTPAEVALLDNISALSKANNVARPWQALTERSFKASGMPLNDLMLGDPTKLAPSMFDMSPLIYPIGDMAAFLTSQGIRSFSTSTANSTLDEGSKSWTASGGGGFLWFSGGGGGSGSSSFSHSMSKLNSLDISFENISEYFVDRSAWFNPAVLQDKDTLKLVKTRREIDNLNFISVSLIIARGTKLTLKFSEKVKAEDWSTSSFNASGGVSWLGFSFGGGGGNSSSSHNVKVDASGTTVTIEDGPTVGRVLGVRVEPFLASTNKPMLTENVNNLATRNENLNTVLGQFLKGESSYLQLQQLKVDTLKKEGAR